MTRQPIRRPAATTPASTKTLSPRPTVPASKPQAPLRRPGYDFASIPLHSPGPAIQRKPSRSGLPDRLKAGIEQLSGLPLDDVRVHYGSPLPARFDADAHTRGREIHLGQGQESLLPHEAWHVVQQARGRVKPTMKMHDGVTLNDDAALEREADVMGAKALGNAAHFHDEPMDRPEPHRDPSRSMPSHADPAEVRDHQESAGAVPAAGEIQLGKTKAQKNKEKREGLARAAQRKAAKDPLRSQGGHEVVGQTSSGGASGDRHAKTAKTVAIRKRAEARKKKKKG